MSGDSTKISTFPRPNSGVSLSDSFKRAQISNLETDRTKTNAYNSSNDNISVKTASVPNSAWHTLGAVAVVAGGFLLFHKWNRSELGFVKKGLDKLIGKQNHDKFANWINSKVIEPSVNYIENNIKYKVQRHMKPLDMNNLPNIETERLGRVLNTQTGKKETVYIHRIYNPALVPGAEEAIKKQWWPVRNERIPSYEVDGDKYDKDIFDITIPFEEKISRGCYVIATSTEDKLFSWGRPHKVIAGARLVYNTSTATSPDLTIGTAQALSKFAPETHMRAEAFANIREITGMPSDKPFTFWEVTGATAEKTHSGKYGFIFRDKTIATTVQENMQRIAQRMNLDVGLGSFTEMNTVPALQASVNTGNFGLVLTGGKYPIFGLHNVYGPGSYDRLYVRAYGYKPRIVAGLKDYEKRIERAEYRPLWNFHEVLTNSVAFKKAYHDIDTPEAMGVTINKGVKFNRIIVDEIIAKA